MNHLQEDIKLTYLIAIFVMLIFACFIILMVIMYNRKQLFYLKEQQLKDAEYQNNLLQIELEKQKIVEKERERISHDMHDDLGAGISALKLQAEFLKQKVDDQILKKDIEELLRTSEEMNVSMREMLWSLNSGNDTLGRFIEYAKAYAQNFLNRTKFQLNIRDENIISETALTTEQRRNLFLCLKEALNNAYKHSDSTQVKISFIQKNKQFIMEVSDNGVGIKEPGTVGNGIRNMKRRMSEQNGKCEITTENGVRIFFKLNL